MAAPDATASANSRSITAPKSRVAALTALAALAVWIAAGIVWLQVSAPDRNLTVTFLDVGQGDSTVIRTPGGHIVVVDAGRISDVDDSGRSVVLPFLRSQGVNYIDALLLTHPDDDHIGGARTILERMRVGRLLISGLPSSSPNYLRVLDTAQAHSVKIEMLARGQVFRFQDSVNAEVLNPPAGSQPRSEHPDNDGSLVLRLRFGRTSVMLTGDAEAAAEQDMLRSDLDLRADILKLGHHGSKTSSTETFLDRVHPAAAVVSAGRRNVFGHPHPDTLEHLAQRNIRVMRTDRDGSIRVVSDGASLRVSTFRNRR